MRLSILGCSGGIGANLRTTCLLLDDDTLIDCGTGAGELDSERMAGIDQVFLTHSHLDHVAALPMFADSAGNLRNAPLTVYALPDTIAILKSHIFNASIWPDYTVQPSPEIPYIRFEAIKTGQTVVSRGRKITALPAKHSIPAVGYLLDSGAGSFAFSGDTTYCEAFWNALKQAQNLRYLLIEATLLDHGGERAEISGHMTPTLIAKGLHKLEHPVAVLITHMEAGREEETMREILALSAEFSPEAVRRGQVFEF